MPYLCALRISDPDLDVKLPQSGEPSLSEVPDSQLLILPCPLMLPLHNKGDSCHSSQVRTDGWMT